MWQRDQDLEFVSGNLWMLLRIMVYKKKHLPHQWLELDDQLSFESNSEPTIVSMIQVFFLVSQKKHSIRFSSLRWNYFELEDHEHGILLPLWEQRSQSSYLHWVWSQCTDPQIMSEFGSAMKFYQCQDVHRCIEAPTCHFLYYLR